ncbi:MAG: DUF2017 domain-containing protein [Corynebacterium sp.]|nr:DUF2017 domain-containing protein [Corynebacterium sp.]
MEAWKKRGGMVRPITFTTVFTPMEREVLGNLASTVANTLMERARAGVDASDPLAELTGMGGGNSELPEEPGLARLLPDFEREGDQQFDGDNALLRELHESDIIAAKLKNLQLVGDKLGPDGSVEVTLNLQEAPLWLNAVNDIRLFLAAEQEEHPHAHDGDNVVEWLGYNVESLLEVLM